MGKNTIIVFRNTDRENIVNYYNVCKKIKQLEKEATTLKDACIKAMLELGHVVDNGKAVKSIRYEGYIQLDGEPGRVEYLETTRSGSIDWKKAYADLWESTHPGEKMPTCEEYRRESSTVPRFTVECLKEKDRANNK